MVENGWRLNKIKLERLDMINMQANILEKNSHEGLEASPGQGATGSDKEQAVGDNLDVVANNDAIDPFEFPLKSAYAIKRGNVENFHGEAVLQVFGNGIMFIVETHLNGDVQGQNCKRYRGSPSHSGRCLLLEWIQVTNATEPPTLIVKIDQSLYRGPNHDNNFDLYHVQFLETSDIAKATDLIRSFGKF